MSKIIDRPTYIAYMDNSLNETYYIKKLEAESALLQWEVPRAFMWNTGPWSSYIKVICLFGIPLLMVYFNNGLSITLLSFSIVFLFIYGSFYYLNRSQYYHVAYRLSDSGILLDNVKVYPRFRYGRQDPTKFMASFRIVAAILVVVALIINPLFLAGAGAAIFLSFIKPWVDEGEKALYCSCLWDDTELREEYMFLKVNICFKRRIIELVASDPTRYCPLFCTKANFDQVVAIVKEKLPNAKYVQEPLNL